MNKYKFLFVNLVFGSVLLFGGLYLVGIALVLGISAAYEGVGILRYFFLSVAIVTFGCGGAGLRLIIPSLIADMSFLFRNGLPKG